jgi:MFS transporter, DHA1 family, multidrug resistance protein
VAMSQVSGRLAGRVALGRLLTAGLAIIAAGGLLLLAAVLTGGGLALVLPALFLVVAGQGLILPNATALALSGRPQHVAGSASAMLGLTQFVIGGLTAPLAGVAGPHTAVPMAVIVAVLTLAAVLIGRLTTR